MNQTSDLIRPIGNFDLTREQIEELCPYQSQVPRDAKGNARYRISAIKRCVRNETAQQHLWNACSRDILFWVNTFLMTFDPRRSPKVLPFVTYPFQDVSILRIHTAINKHDLLMEKSRDMGASWMLDIVFLYHWLFVPMSSLLLVSRKEELVDSSDKKSLFWKIDFMLQHLPRWMIKESDYTRVRLHLINNLNGSSIDGESTTGDVARGDRRTAIGLDEFASVEDGYNVLASTADASKCRIFNSTPKGVGNAFYEVRRQENIQLLTLHWTQHPIKRKGLYAGPHGEPRSPWYDAECERRSHPIEVAQELDIDYLGADYQFFDSDQLREYSGKHCREPQRVGEVDFDRETMEVHGFREASGGRLKLWVQRPDDDHEYVIAADVSSGTGASNSVISVADVTTGLKVAEFVSSTIAPDELARVYVAMAKYFCGMNEIAFGIWEANGPGRIFGNALIEIGYRSFWYKRDENQVAPRPSQIPGWFNTPQTFLTSMGELRRAMIAGDFRNPSREAVRECGEYVYTQQGKIVHSRAQSTPDLSGAREQHGDRVISDMLLWKVMKAPMRRAANVSAAEPPKDSFAGRRKAYLEQKAVKDMDGWGDSQGCGTSIPTRNGTSLGW